MLSMQAADASGTNQAKLQRMCRHSSSPFLLALQTDASQILPVPLSARFRTAHPGEGILFYNNPSTIAACAQPLCDWGKRHPPALQIRAFPMNRARSLYEYLAYFQSLLSAYLQACISGKVTRRWLVLILPG